MADNNNNNESINNNNISDGNEFGDEEVDSNTSVNQADQGSGNDQDPNLTRRKQYQRHTHHQFQELEAFFRECSHQGKELCHRLGLDHHQVKFWFQNKRTQLKNHHDRKENIQLRAENEKLKTEIAQLKTEIERLSTEARKRVSEPVMRPRFMTHLDHSVIPEMGANVENIGNLMLLVAGIAESNKKLIMDLAVEAMEELMKMAQLDEPLWQLGRFNGTSLALNMDEYSRAFPKGLGPRLNGFRTEASKDTTLVAMDHMNIVEILMDVNLWSTIFAALVAKTTNPEVISNGLNGNFNETLYLMPAEFQVLSPRVPTRDVVFARYCKKQGDGLWAVVDVSIESLVSNKEFTYRRRPSGCLIQEFSPGYSKVTWVEHVEINDQGKVHYLYKHLLTTSQAFGASRWVATLDRQCERLVSLRATDNIQMDGLITITNYGKYNILKLAERMSRIFFAGMTTSIANMWTTLPSNRGGTIRVMTRTNKDDQSVPRGIIFCAATSFWIRVPPKTVFDFLRDANHRNKWDVLPTGGCMKKMSQIVTGSDTRNCVSLLQSDEKKIMMIQECSIDPTVAFVIYAPVDPTATETALSEGPPEHVPILPCGFSIFPDGMARIGKEGGSLVNVAFQVLVDEVTFSSIETVEQLVIDTVQKIKTFFYPE